MFWLRNKTNNLQLCALFHLMFNQLLISSLAQWRNFVHLQFCSFMMLVYHLNKNTESALKRVENFEKAMPTVCLFGRAWF